MPDTTTEPAVLQWRPHGADPPADTGDSPHTPPLAHVVFAASADVFACPLIWLDGDFRAESWRLDGQLEGNLDTGSSHGWDYVRHPRLAFAAIHIDDGEPSDRPEAIQHAARDAYRRLFALQRELGLPHAQRIWHWLSAVTAGAGDDQRYQRFCRGRAEALDDPGHSMATLPPATLVSSHRRGLRMHALLGDTPVTPVENPRQVSAYRYPRDYGVRAPAFARAGVARLADSRYLLISGTASIVGHASRHLGDVGAQAAEALANVAAVVEAAAPVIGHACRVEQLQCIKAYLRRPADMPVIAAFLRERLPGVPCALLHAPLCRDELLVEFEAQMLLD